MILAPQPIVQIRDAKAPDLADVSAEDLSAAGHLLKRLWMNAKKSSGFDGIEQRLKFGDREARLSRNLRSAGWECVRHCDLQ